MPDDGAQDPAVRARILIGDSRSMAEVGDRSVHLVVTSPPYWHIKDYGVAGQIGYGQSLHQYLRDLYLVWAECRRVLAPGSRLCVNVGDQFARAEVYGRYRVIPIHAEVIAQCERLGFDFLGSVIWRKKTTVRPSGGANVMGSYPYPPNGILELDYEYIHVFKKPGAPRKIAGEVKRVSALSRAEWKEYFAGHWQFAGARKTGHEARFPNELPRRLIRMFTFVGDTVLDPFLGSGTTAAVALELGRNAVGYEINPAYAKQMRESIKGLGVRTGTGRARAAYRVERAQRRAVSEEAGYTPAIAEISSAGGRPARGRVGPECRKVTAIVDQRTLELEDGRRVRLLGIRVTRREEALVYLKRYVLGKQVFLKAESTKAESVSGRGARGRRGERGAGAQARAAVRAGGAGPAEAAAAYVYLRNRIFVNGHLVRAGLAVPNGSAAGRLGRQRCPAVRSRPGVE